MRREEAARIGGGICDKIRMTEVGAGFWAAGTEWTGGGLLGGSYDGMVGI